MERQAVFVRSMVLFPDDDDPAALGLLLVDDSEGARLSVVVDADWVRTALAGQAAGADLTLLEVPASVQLPIAASGWPEDWDDSDDDQVRDMALSRRAAADWSAFRRQICDALDHAD